MEPVRRSVVVPVMYVMIGPYYLVWFMAREFIDKWSKPLFWVCLAGSFFCSPAVALFAGIAFAMSLGTPVASFSKRWSKRLLQYVVVGLGFGMNLHSSLAAGRDGMIFTVVSVIGVLVLGFLIGRLLGVRKKSSYLISVGTAICGGSAIAAVSPVINADDDDISLSLATVFILNAVALFVFPPIGEWLELTQHQFGTWAAIAIHDTSSVVGAGMVYGEEALLTATTIKLTRALWIIPLAFVSALLFRCKGTKVSVPWFILLFVAAMLVNTYLPVPQVMLDVVKWLSHSLLSITLFLIGSTLSISVVRNTGVKPLVEGILLWVIISGASLAAVML